MRNAPGGTEHIMKIGDKTFHRFQPHMHPDDLSRDSEIFGAQRDDTQDVLSDSARLCSFLRSRLDLKTCKWANDGHGWFVNKWECDREVCDGDRCAESASGKKAVKRLLMENFGVSEEVAKEKMAAMKEEGHISTYSCGRVFFN